MERCPCCKSRLRESTICPRCQADLSGIINTEELAKVWLTNAIQYWSEHKFKQSIDALEFSIHLKKTELAFAFRGFLIEQQYQNILQQLTQNKIFPAKKSAF